jgi:hypothetical protein
VAVAEARGDRVEELLHHRGIRHHRQHLAPGVEGVALGQGHHLVGEAPHGLGLRLGGHDPLMAKQGNQ